MKLYHATLKENVFKIQKEGIKPSLGGVYLCKSPEDCLKFFTINPLYRGKNFAVIPIDLDEGDLEESFDHNRNHIDCDAYVYPKAIPPEDIPTLKEILLYKLG